MRVLTLRPTSLRVLFAAGLFAACGCDGLTSASDPSRLAFLPSRIAVQDLSVVPSSVAAGTSARIRFRLFRTGGGLIYWTSHFLETPARGGVLSVRSGGPVASGTEIEMVYTTKGPTVAFVTLYPASTPAAPTGDGSGDWQSFTIEVTSAP